MSDDRRGSLPAPGAEDVIYLVDVSSFVFRAYFSIGHLSASDGTPTGAVFGVANMLVALTNEHRPARIAAAMDSRTPTFRKEIYEQYKANRPPPPPDLQLQFPLVGELLDGFGVTVLQRDGYEADDVIATAVRVAREAGLRAVIVSGDKDLMQLVSPEVVMLDTMKDRAWDAAAVEERWQVPPALLGDLLAIAGDSSDNIPGVPRMGPKTAAPLLREHGGLEPLLAGLDSLKSRAARKRLAEHAEAARLGRRLVALEERVPLEIDLDRTRYRAPSRERLAPLLERLEMTKLRDRLFEAERGGDEPAYRTVADRGGLEEVADRIREAGRFAVDLETTSLDVARAEIVGVALGWRPLEAVYVPVAHREGPALGLDDVLQVLAPLLEDRELGVIAQNVKYEDAIFRRHGVRIENVAFDPMLASYLLRSEGRTHNLSALARDVLGRSAISYDEVTSKSRGHQLEFFEVPVESATRYAGEDAELALALTDALVPRVERAGMSSLLHEVEIPLARVLAGMELSGVAVDVELLREMSEEFAARIERVERKAHELAGHEFNLGSPKQLQEVLFDELGLPTQRKTKTGYSTDSEVLEVLARYHPLPAAVLEHRMLAKLRGTYLEALPRLVSPASGRIHTSYNQAVTVTGRLSSSNPNLQNIPVRTERGREIRRAFVAEPGRLLLSLDYSQVELRVLAHLSGDEELLDAFRRGEDVHARTARRLFGYGDEGEVDREHRAQAKAVNFGVIYGKTDYSLGRELGIPRAEAGRFIEEYFSVHSGVARYMDETIERARSERAVTTMLGRRRELRDIDSRNRNARLQAERMARNTPIQGTAADLLKLAMIRVQSRLEREEAGARMIMTVHDELVLEVPEEEIEGTEALAREEMQGALELEVPLVVDAGVGASWAEAH